MARKTKEVTIDVFYIPCIDPDHGKKCVGISKTGGFAGFAMWADEKQARAISEEIGIVYKKGTLTYQKIITKKQDGESIQGDKNGSTTNQPTAGQA